MGLFGEKQLVRMADIFVFYDDVKVSRQNWQSRNQIKTAWGTQWLVVPVLGSNDATVRESAPNACMRLPATRSWTRRRAA